MSERSRVTQIPGTLCSVVNVDAQAKGTHTSTVLFPNEWESSIVINGAYWVPNAAITPTSTHIFAIQLQNVGLLGVGSTAVTSALTVNVAYGSVTALVPIALTLSTTAANLVLAAGEVLALVKTETSNGNALPTGKLALTYQFV